MGYNPLKNVGYGRKKSNMGCGSQGMQKYVLGKHLKRNQNVGVRQRIYSLKICINVCFLLVYENVTLDYNTNSIHTGTTRHNSVCYRNMQSGIWPHIWTLFTKNKAKLGLYHSTNISCRVICSFFVD